MDREKDKKPANLCAVKGMPRPGVMCGYITVGFGYCGAPKHHPCPHREKKRRLE